MLRGISSVSNVLWVFIFLNNNVYSFSQITPAINGLLNVYKPYGLTSTYVSNKIKNIIVDNNSGRKRLKIQVGHGGTLDKYTEGVLAIGIGAGTKALDKYLKGEKEYKCTGTFGFETDTNDLIGKRLYSAPWSHITHGMLDTAISSMRGLYMQEAPKYSAKKLSGIPLYKYAINDVDIPTKVSLVHIMDIYRIKNEELPNFSLFVRCSGGMYVRSLIRDIGKRLNSRATMSSLIRTKKLNFDVKDSLPFEELTYENILKNLKPVHQVNVL
ncbi:tRNA pseudouridine(55) synthase [Theileria orientalis]|uniref:tRNA pseudouridine(55) synthase n=1 Tax=Theileria orientalis TaxID=68886 RepID=A0A976M8B7_THEOR|nr:tRNA pseudouridine(55) synthase [Theileria orientalis]